MAVASTFRPSYDRERRSLGERRREEAARALCCEEPVSRCCTFRSRSSSYGSAR